MNDAEARELHPEFYGKFYNFFRRGFFYTIELGSDDQARENAEYNLGTIRVEDVNGNVVWPINN
jgi:hypothetical protein